MIITSLRLTNLRAIETAEFDFQPGFNLIVGVNGVGKTSVLDALAVCLSAIVKETNKIPTRTETFSARDIRIGADTLTVECRFRFFGQEISYLVHRPRDTATPQAKKAGMPREQVFDTPIRTEFLSPAPGKPPILLLPKGEPPPLAVLFSTNRAVPNERAPTKAVAAGGIRGAVADAYAKRELRLHEFANWLNVQATLSSELTRASRVLAACEEAVARFLPGYRNLRTDGSSPPQLWIDRVNTPIPVRALSDGERGSLALVLDLTRRLVQANPDLSEPAREGEAVVLIDEIDLHLHPKWQRRIVRDLEAAFPRCQFIATTHSPQVIGEVPHDRIQVISEGHVYSPTHSYGVDASRVLEELMETDPRTGEVQTLLGEISSAISRNRFDVVRRHLHHLAEQLGDADPEVTRLRTLLDFMEDTE